MLSILRYRSSPQKLPERLREFGARQFQIVSHDGEVYKGEIRGYHVPNPKVKRLIIVAEWLCKRHIVFNDVQTKIERWERVKPPQHLAFPELVLNYTIYYHQPEENRWKIQTSDTECWFYPEGHPEGLYNVFLNLGQFTKLRSL